MQLAICLYQLVTFLVSIANSGPPGCWLSGLLLTSANSTSFLSAGLNTGMANCHSEAQQHRKVVYCDLYGHQESFLVVCPHSQMWIDGGGGIRPLPIVLPLSNGAGYLLVLEFLYNNKHSRLCMGHYGHEREADSWNISPHVMLSPIDKNDAGCWTTVAGPKAKFSG